MPKNAPEIHDLPAELGAVLSFLSVSEGRSVTLVSKRFRRLFYEQPRLWRRFELAPPSIIGSEFKLSQFLAAKHALLQRMAPLWQNSLCGSHILPEQLTWQLDGSGGHRPLAAFLQQLPPSLTALDLQLQSTLPLQAGQAMQQLAALRSLSLNDVQAADMLPAVLQHMPQLERALWASPEAEAVAQLSQLRHLQLALPETPNIGVLFPPPPAAFPLLQTFDDSGGADGVVHLAGIRCRRCLLLPTSVADESPATLVLRGFTAVPGWFADLLAAATPPSVAPEALFLSRVRFSAAALQGCTQLAALRALELSHCSCDEAAAAALFDCVLQLAALSMDVSLAAVKCAFFSQPRPQLRKLELYGSLHTSLHSLAPGLSLLSGLQYLDCRCQRSLRLKEDAVELLARLPHLRTLRLAQRAMEQSAAGVLQALQLVVLLLA